MLALTHEAQQDRLRETPVELAAAQPHTGNVDELPEGSANHSAFDDDDVRPLVDQAGVDVPRDSDIAHDDWLIADRRGIYHRFGRIGRRYHNVAGAQFVHRYADLYRRLLAHLLRQAAVELTVQRCAVAERTLDDFTASDGLRDARVDASRDDAVERDRKSTRL